MATAARRRRGANTQLASVPPPVQVRVWWPPTSDETRTGFAGAYWPAAILSRCQTHAVVRYDNGETDRVSLADALRADLPVAFGGEDQPLQVWLRVLVLRVLRLSACVAMVDTWREIASWTPF